MVSNSVNSAGSSIHTTGSLEAVDCTDNSRADHSLNNTLSPELFQNCLSFLIPQHQPEAGCVAKEWNETITSLNEHEAKLNLMRIVDNLVTELTDRLPDSREALDKLEEIKEAVLQLRTEGKQINRFKIHHSKNLKEIQLLYNRTIEAWLLRISNSIHTIHIFLNDDAVMSKFFEKVNSEIYSESSILSTEDFVNIIELKLLYALNRLSAHLTKEAKDNQEVANFIKKLDDTRKALLDSKNSKVEEENAHFEKVSALYDNLIKDWLDLELVVCINTLSFFFQEPEVLKSFFRKFCKLHSVTSLQVPSLCEKDYLKALEAAWFCYRITDDIQMFQFISSRKASFFPRENALFEDFKMLSLYFVDKKNEIEAFRVALSMPANKDSILDLLIEKLVQKLDYQEILSIYFECRKDNYKIYKPEMLIKQYAVHRSILGPILAKHCKLEETVICNEFENRAQSAV